jgi:hypothetical protein
MRSHFQVDSCQQMRRSRTVSLKEAASIPIHLHYCPTEPQDVEPTPSPKHAADLRSSGEEIISSARLLQFDKNEVNDIRQPQHHPP